MWSQKLIVFFFSLVAEMAYDKNYVTVIICYGGDFVIGDDEWEYEGGMRALSLYIYIKNASYIGFVRDIVTFLSCRVQKLLYCVS